MPPERSKMRIYVSNGKVFAEFDETVELGRITIFSTINQYKSNLVEHVSGLFDTIIRNAALIGLSESKEPKDNSESVAVKTETASKQPEAETKLQENEPKQPEKLFRAPKDGVLKPEAKKTRRKIDYGKIMALHNAGWSNQKIANEMGMTYNAVATAISNYKKKMKEGGRK